MARRETCRKCCEGSKFYCHMFGRRKFTAEEFYNIERDEHYRPPWCPLEDEEAGDADNH